MGSIWPYGSRIRSSCRRCYFAPRWQVGHLRSGLGHNQRAECSNSTSSPHAGSPPSDHPERGRATPSSEDVALQTTDGSEIARARGDVEASDPADRDKNAAVGNTALVLAMNFDNLIFPEFGTYQLALTWDGDDLRPPIQLSVKQTPDS